jgi:predicted nuclease of restriction endonuclease-like (RecB) superfamily
MRKFHALINNVDALRQELSWTHYTLIIKLDDENKRDFYIDECIKSNWSTRQLERQINSFYYERLLSTQEENRNEFRNEIKELEPSNSRELFDK